MISVGVFFSYLIKPFIDFSRNFLENLAAFVFDLKINTFVINFSFIVRFLFLVYYRLISDNINSEHLMQKMEGFKFG